MNLCAESANGDGSREGKRHDGGARTISPHHYVAVDHRPRQYGRLLLSFDGAISTRNRKIATDEILHIGATTTKAVCQTTNSQPSLSMSAARYDLIKKITARLMKQNLASDA